MVEDLVVQRGHLEEANGVVIEREGNILACLRAIWLARRLLRSLGLVAAGEDTSQRNNEFESRRLWDRNEIL